MARKKDVIDPLLEEVLYELIAEKINAIPPAEAEVQIPAERRSHSEMSGVPIPT